MNSYQYQKLPERSSGDSIRLLTLQPGADLSELSVTLAIIPLSENPTYEALSYCWGDASNKLVISCHGKPFPVTRSLESALRHIRLPDEERIIWIDAICINQDDIDERSYQVSLMREIYASAEKVLVWLGEAGDSSELVFPLCERMVEHRLELLTDDTGPDVSSAEVIWAKNKSQMLKDRLAQIKQKKVLEVEETGDGHESDDSFAREGPDDEGHDSSTDGSESESEKVDDSQGADDETPDTSKAEATAFLTLLRRPWFNRCWVIQEAVLGQNITVHCGDDSIDWSHFYCGYLLAIGLSEFAVKGRSEELRQSRGLGLMMDVKMKKIQQGDIYAKTVDLLWLLWKARSLGATDARDKVYSILGLLPPGQYEYLRLQPDYTISVEECFQRAGLATIKQRQNLDLLLTDRVPGLARDCPSWVPNWGLQSEPAPTLLIQDEDLNKLEDPESHKFHASLVKDCEPTIRPHTNHLVVSGHVFDKIVDITSQLTAPQSGPVQLNEMTTTGVRRSFQVLGGILDGVGSYLENLVKWERLAYSKKYPTYPTGEDREVVMALTLCVGRVAEGGAEKALSGYRMFRARLSGPKKVSSLKYVGFGGSPYRALLAISGVLSRGGPSDRVFTSATERTLSRRLARTKTGYLAVVPESAVVGDEVVLLKGSKAPLVLRPTANNGEKEFIGPAYVHGIMYGEKWDEQLARDIDLI